MKIEAPEVVADVAEVVEAARKTNLFTPKRIAIAVGVTVAVAGTIVLVKKIRAAKAEQELEDNA